MSTNNENDNETEIPVNKEYADKLVNVDKFPPVKELKLPDAHPASNLEPGQSRIVNGVIIKNSPKLDSPQQLIWGLPMEYSKKLKLDLDSDSKLSKEEKQKFSLENFLTLADYYGSMLEGNKKNELRNLYESTFKRGLKLSEESSKSKDQVITQMSNLLTDLVIDEMKIFADNEKAQKLRYGNTKKNQVISSKALENESKLKVSLQSAYVELLNGNYLQSDTIKSSKEQVIINKGDGVQLINKNKTINDYKVNTKAYTPLLNNENVFAFESGNFSNFLPINDNWISYDPATEQILGYESRIYSSEHSIISDAIFQILRYLTGIDWTDFLTDLGLVHVNIVAGIWILKKTQATMNTVVFNKKTGMYELVTRDITVFSEDFYEWVVANGCAGEYLSGDTLILKELTTWNSFDSAYKYLMTSTPTSGGKYYQVRICAYSVGDYARNWVCHQNANAFTKRRWNFVPILYPTNLIYNLYSNNPFLQISRRKDPIFQTYPHRGGVPGNWLYYENMIPYAFYGWILQFASGTGYNLAIKWNPKKNLFVLTHAAYKHANIPFNGPDSFFIVLGHV